MIRIEKKTWLEYFQAVLEGRKTCELRLADFECKPGDELVLREWDPKTEKYSGREIKKVVTYVGRTKDYAFWSKQDVEKYGYQIISFS